LEPERTRPPASSPRLFCPCLVHHDGSRSSETSLSHPCSGRKSSAHGRQLHLMLLVAGSFCFGSGDGNWSPVVTDKNRKELGGLGLAGVRGCAMRAIRSLVEGLAR